MATYQGEILLDNPIAYWRLGEITETIADNLGSLGSAVDGTYSGSPLFGISGLIGDSNTAVKFDGVDDGVLIPDNSSINTGASYSQKTIELTFSADTVTGTRIIYEQGDTTNGLNIYLKDNQLKLGAWASNSGQWLSYEISADKTYHVVLVFNAGQLTGYVNGKSIGTVSTTFTSIPTHTGDIGIARLSDDTRFSNTVSTTEDSGYYFDGIIDEVVLYNTALSASRIQTHYEAAAIPLSLTGSGDNDYLVGGTGNDTIVGDGDSDDNVLNLDGVNDYVNLNAGLINLATGDFTLEAWIKTTGTTEAILVKNDGDTSWEKGEKAFYINSVGKVEFVGYGNSYIKGGTAVNDGQWHHVAVVWDYSSGTAGTGRIYVDGVNVTTSSTYAANNVDNSGETLKIALPNYGEATNYFSGQMDEIRVWNVARTETEIKTNYNRTLNGTQTGLVGYWNFNKDTNSSTAIANSTANGNNGTLVNGGGSNIVFQSNAGHDTIVGGAGNDYLKGGSGNDVLVGDSNDNTLNLDGVNDYVQIANESYFDSITSAITIETWIKVDSFTKNWQAIVTKGDNSWRLHRNDTENTLNFYIEGVGGVNSTTTVNDGQWHHVAAVYDGSKLQIYIDGVLNGQTTASGAIPTNNYNILIGENEQQSGRYFYGQIDDVRIWNVARSATEISNNLNATLTGKETGLVGYWNFNENSISGNTITDLTGNGNNGTLFNGQGNNFIAKTSGGNDTLEGGAGNDTLTGNAGADTFVFNSLSEGIDTITDFDGTEGDLIEVSRDGFGIIGAKVNNFTYNSTTGTLSFNGTQFATLKNPVSFNFTNSIYIKEAAAIPLSLTGSGDNDYLVGGTGNDTIVGDGDSDDNVLNLDGVNDYVNLNAGLINLATGDFTLEAWIKTTGTTEAILVKNDGDTSWEKGEKAFYINSVGKVEFVGYGNSYIKGGTAVNDGQWHHVAVVWDYSSGTAGTGRIYVDGVNVTTSSTYAANNVDNSGETLKIALPNYGEATNYFSGQMDEIRVWNVARTETEIKTNYNRTLNGTQTGLVGYWNFNKDTNSSTAIANSTANGNNGTLVNGGGSNIVFQSNAGHDTIVGGAGNDYLKGGSGNDVLVGDSNDNTLNLDGVNDYVQIANESYFDSITSAITIETWIKVDSFTKNWQAIVTKGDNSWRLHRNDTENTLNFYIEGVGGVNSTTTVNDGQWHHVAAVYDGSKLQIYIDGVLNGQTTASGAIPTNNYNILIGENEQQSGRYFYGQIDDVRIWNVARSATEISNNLNATLTGKETGLVGYWNFNENSISGNTITDLTGNGNNGTLFNGQGNNFIAKTSGGNDTLEGGAGNDTLTGNAGADTFVFNSLSEGIDTITDFDGTEGDLIAVSRDGFGISGAKVNNFTYNSTTGALSFDGTQFATLKNPSSFNLSNSIYIKDEYRKEVESDNPIAYWRLGDSTGTVADNLGSLGSAVDGTYSNSPTLGASSLVWSGYRNTAADFDGINDGVLIPDNTSVNAGNSYSQKTIELWFKADKLTGTQVLYEQGGQTNGLNIFLEGTQLKMGAWVNQAGNWLSQAVSIGNIYHVVLVFDAGKLTGYVNGEAIGTATTSFTAIPSHTTDVAIAQMSGETRFSNTSSYTGNGYYFDGIIDEVALYNTALSGTQVQEHYDAAAAPQTLTGSTGNDTLVSGTGDDTISGGAGNDIIAGNGGQNSLTGGAGSDDFIFTEVSHFVDTIQDFTPTKYPYTQFNVSSIFNADVIHNSGDSTQDATVMDSNAYVLVTDNFAKSLSSSGNGLPDDGYFGAQGYRPEVKLSYHNNNNGLNARVVTNNGEYFSFTTESKQYAEVHLFASATHGSSTMNVTLTYSDGTTTTQTALSIPDWFYEITETSDRYYLVDGMDRYKEDTGVLYDANNPAIFGFRIAADPTKTLCSVTVTKSSSTGRLVFLGATGVAQAQTERDRIIIASSFGATSLEQFSFDAATGGLLFAGTKFATLAGVSSLDLASNIVIQQSFKIAENSANGTSIGSVAINNPAATTPYKIISGNDQGIFALNASTGEITVANSAQLNYETIADSYQIEVKVADTNGRTSTKLVTIKVTDVNEAPIINNYSFSIPEGSAEDTVIGTVTATDPDAGDSKYYQITAGNESNIFNVGSLTGQITIGANSSKLDYETATSYTLTVRVTDSAGKTDDATVTINVTDVNEAPVLDNQSFYIHQFGTQSDKGDAIGKVVASDDNGDTLTYSIVNGNSNNFFAINSATGQLSINPNLTATERKNLIKSTARSFELTVAASDGELSDTATITLEKSIFKDVFSRNGQSNAFSEFNDKTLSTASHAAPSLADLDRDGDLDAFVGKNAQMSNTNIRGFQYYENIDGILASSASPNNPAYAQSLSTVGFNPKAAFADVDNDGDLDVVIGDDEGTISYLQNNNGNYSEKSGSDNPFSGIDVGSYASPAFADIDTDGDLDAFIGKDVGGIFYYQNNNGTFSFNDGGINGYNAVASNASPTFADINNDGYLDLIVGSGDGTISYFQNDGDGTFTQQTGSNNPFNGIDVGTNAAPTIGDLDSDGYLDLAIGAANGDVYYYRGTSRIYEVTFSSTNQSTWGSGSSIKTAFNWEPFDPIKWNYTFNKDFGFIDFGGGTAGDFHFRTGYEIDSGTINSTLPFDIMVNAPKKVAIGDKVTISTGYSLSDSASFSTTTPYVSAYLDLGLMFYLGAYASIDYKVGKYTYDIADQLGTNIDYSIDFEFDTRDGEYSKTFFDFADFTLSSPDIAVSGTVADDNTLSGSAEDVFLSTEISLDDLIVEKFLKQSSNVYMQALGNAWQNDFNIGVAGVEWDLLDLDLIGDISLKTSYALDFDSLNGQVILENGTTKSFTAGDDVSIDLLTGMDTNHNSKLDYALKFDLVNPKLTTKVDLVFDLDFDIAALQGSAWYDVWLSKGSKDFGPVYDRSFDIAKGSINIYNQTFALGGFSSTYINDLAITIV
ncbi:MULTISPECIES: LamG-like jellyroll fold domain-containing protein [Scytonema]|uniref:LamG-like jellyroll fold domain-containing protein n=1 Tax=Scytonema tolypothrichoides VB-61278_2 TaxID=3232314 RepID=A0ABW8WIT5_9CYAN